MEPIDIEVTEPISFDMYEVSRIKNYAAEHPLDRETLVAIAEGNLPAPGNIRNYVYRAGKLRVVYTHEHHFTGWHRHISVSYDEQVPPPKLLLNTLTVFGFLTENTTVRWIEHYGEPDEVGTYPNRAYNAVSPLQSLLYSL